MRKTFVYTATVFLYMLSSCQIKAQITRHLPINWLKAGSLPDAEAGKATGLAGAFAGASGNILWIAGGSNFSNGLPWEGGTKNFHDTIFYFQKIKGKEELQLLPRRHQLPLPIAYGTSVAVGNKVVCAGGQNNEGFSSKVYLASIRSSAEISLQLKPLPDLPSGLANAAGTSYGNKIYLAGGETVNGVSDQMLSLDLTAPGTSWKVVCKLPHAVSHAVLIEQTEGKNHYLYLVGGRRKDASGISEIYASVFRYDMLTAKWEERRSMPYPLSAHTGVASGKNTILVFGGDKGTVFHQAEVLLAAIDQEKNEAKKAELVLAKNKLQNQHPGFCREVLEYNTLSNEWQMIDSLPFPAPVTTTAIRWGKSIILPSGEIKAGIRTPLIMLGKVSVK